MSAAGAPANGLNDDDWDMLLQRIKSGSCTPFLGAGACAGTLPLGADVARKWADRLRVSARRLG